MKKLVFRRPLVALRDGLHSNIPLCCVLQFLVENYVLIPLARRTVWRSNAKGEWIAVAHLPWRAPHYRMVNPPPGQPWYWPCAIHQWLITRRWCEPRSLYLCGAKSGTTPGEYAVPCPHCNKRVTRA